MTYYGGKELASSFATVRKNTIQIAQEIPEEQYNFTVSPETRSVAQMLVHVAIAPGLFWRPIHEARLTSMEGFDIFETMRQLKEEEAKPRTKSEVVDLLTGEGQRFCDFLETMSESDLAERVSSPVTPAPRSRFEMLLGAKEHEMHHRAQLMLIERQLGIVPHLTRQMNARVEEMMKARAGT